jgi:hypothetical protein
MATAPTYNANETAQTIEPSYQLPQTDVSVLQGKKILQYPLGLGSTIKDEYGKDQQYMLFKINTDEKTTALRNDKKGAAVVLPLGTRMGTGVSSTANVDAKSADPDMRIKYGDAAVDATNWVEQKGMVRLDKVIVLPMPQDHSVVTRLQYKDDSKQTALTKLGDIMTQNGGDVAKDLTRMGVSGLINAISAGATTYDAQLAESRLLTNPKVEVMFEGFSFRRFSFSWQFAPKSIQESDMVRDIIETFRYYALPEISGGKFFYIFPSEFEISFMQGQKDNPNIPKITTSVLENISVDYSPNSVWGTLPNGASIATRITVNFLELELVDRTRVYNANSTITSGY